jgi:hypothetical protein
MRVSTFPEPTERCDVEHPEQYRGSRYVHQLSEYGLPRGQCSIGIPLINLFVRVQLLELDRVDRWRIYEYVIRSIDLAYKCICARSRCHARLARFVPRSKKIESACRGVLM